MTSCKPRILAIAGGSCSGKTTLANRVAEKLGPTDALVIRMDNYYFTNAGITDPAETPNFDDPSAIDFQRLCLDLTRIKSGQKVEAPVYDFVSRRRQSATTKLKPRTLVIVEGVLALRTKEIRMMYDYSCFVECPEKLRLSRRVERDVKERGRSESSVREQFSGQVAPMHDAYVEPSKCAADLVVSQAHYCQQAERLVDTLIRAALARE